MFVRRWDGSDEARILNAVRVFGFGRVLKNRWVFAFFCKLLIFIKLSRAKVFLLSLRSEVVVILQRSNKTVFEACIKIDQRNDDPRLEAWAACVCVERDFDQEDR